MVSELRWKPAIAGGAVQRSTAAGAAGGAEKGFDPKLSTAFAERGRLESPGSQAPSTGLSARISKEATA
jgi:hypothetical protein